MIISGWSKQTNLMKQPWIFGEPYTTINRKYMTLKMRLTPYLVHLFARGVRHGRADRPRHGARVPGRRGHVVQADAVPVHERRVAARRPGLRGFADSQRHLPARRQVDRLLGRARVQRPDDGERLRRRRSTGFRCSSRRAPSSRCIRRCSTTARSRRTRSRFDIYPFGKTSFSLYEDDGVTQRYRTGAFARTLVEVDAPKSLDEAGAQITVTVGAAKGSYHGMPASRSYVGGPARPGAGRPA